MDLSAREPTEAIEVSTVCGRTNVYIYGESDEDDDGGGERVASRCHTTQQPQTNGRERGKDNDIRYLASTTPSRSSPSRPAAYRQEIRHVRGGAAAISERAPLIAQSPWNPLGTRLVCLSLIPLTAVGQRQHTLLHASPRLSHSLRPSLVLSRSHSRSLIVTFLSQFALRQCQSGPNSWNSGRDTVGKWETKEITEK